MLYGIMMDGVHCMLPQRYLVYGKHSKLNSRYPVLTEDNKKGFYLDETGVCEMGEYARNISNDMIDMIELFAKNKRNLIIDYVLFGLEETKIIANRLKNFDAYIIRIFCEPEELKRREVARGDRTIGSAVVIQKLIDTKYNDYVLNSTTKKPVELAQELYNFVNINQPKALKKLCF